MMCEVCRGLSSSSKHRRDALDFFVCAPFSERWLFIFVFIMVRLMPFCLFLHV